MKNDNIKSFVVLVAICIVIAGLMSVVNVITRPEIERIENEKVQKSLTVVMPNGEDFIKMENFNADPSVSEIYAEKNGGYVFKIITTGYASGMTVMCGVNKDGNITGAECIASGETLEAEKTYGGRFTGVNSDNVDNVDTVSGATLTTRAYKNAIKTALETFKYLAGSELS